MKLDGPLDPTSAILTLVKGAPMLGKFIGYFMNRQVIG